MADNLESDQIPNKDHCAKCGKELDVKSKLACGKLYHVDCFKCTSCDEVMTRYVMNDGMPYCLLCTHTMFEPQCAECGSWLFGRKSEKKPPVFALGRLYHSRCFQCAECESRILGKFYISEIRKIYCPKHPPQGTSEVLKTICNEPTPEDKNEYLYEDENAAGAEDNE